MSDYTYMLFARINDKDCWTMHGAFGNYADAFWSARIVTAGMRSKPWGAGSEIVIVAFDRDGALSVRVPTGCRPLTRPAAERSA